MQKKSFPHYDAQLYIDGVVAESIGLKSEEHCTHKALREKIKDNKEANHQVFTVIGGIGSGKTWFLKHLESDLKESGLQCFYLDFFTLIYGSESWDSRAVEIIYSLSSVFDTPLKSREPDYAVQEFVDIAEEFDKSKRKVYFLLDNILDAEWKLLGGLEDLLGSLANFSGVTIVMSGQGRLYPWGAFDLSGKKNHIYKLKPFSEYEVSEFIKKLKKQDLLKDNDIKNIYLTGRGYPGLTYSLINIAKENLIIDVKDIQNACLDYLKQVCGDLKDFVNIVNDLRMLSVLDSFTDSHIQGLIFAIEDEIRVNKDSLPGEKRKQLLDEIHERTPREIRERLVGLKFVQWEKEKNSFILDESLKLAAQEIGVGRLDGDKSYLGSRSIDNIKKFAAGMSKKLADDFNSDFDKYVEFRVSQNYASKKIDLVGEEYINVRDNIVSCVSTGKKKLFYIYGDGGIGKTKVIEDVLDTFHNNATERIFAVDAAIDLFHTAYNQADGLQSAICDSLCKSSFSKEENIFFDYQKKRSEKDKAFVFSGKRPAVEILREAWLNDFKEAEEKGLVLLVFDTAEKLFLYRTDEEYVDFTGDDRERGLYRSLNWLFNTLIPQLKNTVVVFSGRLDFNIEPIKNWLNKDRFPSFEIEDIKLSGFTRKDIQAYWDKVKTENKINNFDVFKELEQVNEKTLDAIYRFCCRVESSKTVFPLTMAVLVDLAMLKPALFDDLDGEFDKWIIEFPYVKHNKALRFLAAQLWGAFNNRSEKLFGHDDLFDYIGKARKGVTGDLLRILMDEDETTYTSRMIIDALQDSKLSIIKLHTLPYDVRPTVYLHDVMYDHADNTSTTRLHQPEFSGKIEKYYEEELKKTSSAIFELMNRFFLHGGLPQTLISEVLPYLRRWNDLATDFVYYKLDSCKLKNLGQNSEIVFPQDMTFGFEGYYKFAEEALYAGDEIFSQLLELEVMEFLLDNQRSASERNSLMKSNLPDLINTDSLVRRVKREKYFGSIDKSLRARDDILKNDKWLEMVKNQGLFYVVDDLETFCLEEFLYRAKPGVGEALNNFYEKFKKDPSVSVQKDIIFSRVCKLLGYSFRIKNNLEEALVYYQQSIELLRKYWEVESEQANTLLNVSYALGALGKYDIALDWALDAKDLRLKRGILSYIGLAYNIIGNIKIYMGSYKDALSDALRARSFFVALREGDSGNSSQITRFEGLNTILLAECYRRTATISNVDAPEFDDNVPEILQQKVDREKYLAKAGDYAKIGIGIFENSIDVDYLIAAYIEKGCSERDYVKFISETQSDLSNEEQHYNDAVEAFEEAHNLAVKNKKLDRAIDAKVNFAWLKFYKSKCHLADYRNSTTIFYTELLEILKFIDEILKENGIEDYLIKDGLEFKKPVKYNEKSPIFGSLGKLFMLRALIEYDGFGRMSLVFSSDTELEKETLKTVASHYEPDDIVQNAIKDFNERVQLIDEYGHKHKELKKCSDNLVRIIKERAKDIGTDFMCLAFEYNGFNKMSLTRDMKRAMHQTHQKLKKMGGNEFDIFKKNAFDFERKLKEKKYLIEPERTAMMEFLYERLFISKKEYMDLSPWKEDGQ